MVDRIRTFLLEDDRLSSFARVGNPLAFPETIGPVSAPSQSPPPLSTQAASHAAGERRAMSIFKSPPEYSGPLVVFLFALGIAFGAYALLPLFLPHKWALPPKDRLTVTDGYLLF
jgi:hypothetical protein